MFNYLVEIFAQEKKRYLINGCGLLETDSSPTVSSLGRLPISTDAAYIHVNGDIGIPKQLYYVCKSRSECALLNITTGARESFDREMKPTAEFRRLTADELDKITMITKHTQNPQPYERWIKYYYENAEQIPDTPSARVNYFMGFAIVTLATLEKVNSTSDQLIIRGQDPIHSKYLWTSLMLLGSILPLRFDNKSIKNHVPGLDLKDEMGFFTRFSTTSLYETEFKKYLNKDHIRYFLTDFTEEAKRKKDLSAAALIASEAKLMTGDPSIPGEAAPYLSQHTGGVNALAVLRDGRLVSGSEDGTIKLWDFNTGRHSSILSTMRCK